MGGLLDPLLSDAALIGKALRDDRVAFEALVFRHEKRAHAVVAVTAVARSGVDTALTFTDKVFGSGSAANHAFANDAMIRHDSEHAKSGSVFVDGLVKIMRQ